MAISSPSVHQKGDDVIYEDPSQATPSSLWGSVRLTYTLCAFFAMILHLCMRNALSFTILCMVTTSSPTQTSESATIMDEFSKCGSLEMNSTHRISEAICRIQLEPLRTIPTSWLLLLWLSDRPADWRTFVRQIRRKDLFHALADSASHILYAVANFRASGLYSRFHDACRSGTYSGIWESSHLPALFGLGSPYRTCGSDFIRLWGLFSWFHVSTTNLQLFV